MLLLATKMFLCFLLYFIIFCESTQVRLYDSASFSKDYFGYSVSTNGKLVLVGAHAKNRFRGSTYLYDCSSFPCVLIDRPTPREIKDNAFFGYSISMSDNQVAISAPGEDLPNPYQGSVYIYNCNSIPCSLVDKLVSDEPKAGAWFGYSVIMSGNIVAVSARYEKASCDSLEIQGKIYIYNCEYHPCTLVEKLSPPNLYAYDFGRSIAVDGDWIAVSAFNIGENINLTGVVFLYNCTLYPCEMSDELLPKDDIEYFGISIAVSENRLVVGSKKNETAKGSVYLYECDPLPCTQVEKINDIERNESEFFGFSLAMEGNTVIVGDEGNLNDQGSVYVYDCSNLPCTQIEKLLAFDGRRGDMFGFSVALKDKMIVAGAHGDDLYKGSAYVFDCTEFPCSDESKEEIKNITMGTVVGLVSVAFSICLGVIYVYAKKEQYVSINELEVQ